MDVKKVTSFFFLLLATILTCKGQSFGLPGFIQDTLVIRVNDDTIFFNSGAIKKTGVFHEKRFDLNQNILMHIGTHKVYYRNSQVKSIVDYDEKGLFLRRRNFYRNGNIKLEAISDTTSNVIHFNSLQGYKIEFEINSLRFFRKDGKLKRHGEWYHYLRNGEWKFYKRNGELKRTKEYSVSPATPPTNDFEN